MGLEKLINREIKITIGVVLFVSILFIALSYAIFKVDKSGASDVIKFGDISLSFCKDATCASNVSNIGNIIGTETDSNGNTVYSKIYPVADPVTNDDWNNLKPYIFTLTNTGSLPLYVSIFLERDMTAGVISDGTSEYSEFVNDDQVKIGFGVQGETPAIGLYSDYLNTTDNNHKIASNIQIGVGETKIFNLYAWLKSDAQNASLGKYFVTQISARGEYLPDGENTQIDENLKTIEIDFKEGTIDKNIKQVQKGNSVEFTLTPSDTSVTLDKLNITCLSGTVPTVSGNTLTISNVQKNEFCQVYKKEQPTLLSQILKDNPTRSVRTDFSEPFTTNTANTLYKATENGIDVYYFAGVENIEEGCEYSGQKITDYSSNKLNENTCSGEIEVCHTDNNEYLYFGTSSCNGFDGSVEKIQVLWTSGVEKPLNNWVKFGKNSSNQDLYWRIIRTNSDGSIRLLYHGISTTATDAYIGESQFNKIFNDSMYVGYMYGTSGSQESNRTNANNSTIKTVIDNWYASNMTSYTKYLSTTAVYCNDREVGSGTYSATGSIFYYAPYARVYTSYAPTYDCTNNNDKFTVDASTGNGKLTYPIALMTADEIAYAGGATSKKAPMWYYTNSSFESSTGLTEWWSLSPFNWDVSVASSWRVFGKGSLSGFGVNCSRSVRPVVSLKSCIKYSTGNGSASDPYTIKETTSGC